MFSAPGRWLPMLKAHADFVANSAPQVRVTAVAPRDAVRRNYAESLELLRIATEMAVPQVTVDVGSGGGFPGLVFAAVFPEMRIHLVEPLQKRARLLEELAHQLGLGLVTVHAQRAEDVARGPLRDTANLVTARAVSELRVLLEYTAPFAAPGSRLMLPKGSALPSELAGASNALVQLSCAYRGIVTMRPEVSATIQVAVFEKTGATDARFPRRAGSPGRNPL